MRTADAQNERIVSVSSRNTQYRISNILLVAILLLALGLRLYRIDAQSLWNDEGTSVALAQRDLATIARDAAADIHPPLYYWLLHGWIKLVGTNETGVRSLSALLGVGLVALIYALGRLLTGRWAGLGAAFLAAVNPFQVYYSQEARMYMLLAVWGALAFYAALRWAFALSPWGERVGVRGELHDEQHLPPPPAPPPREGSNARLGWAIVYVLAGAAGLYTHYAFPLVLLPVNLVVLLDMGLRWRQTATMNRRSERAKPAKAGSGQGDSLPFVLAAGPVARWLALQAAVALLFLPWLPAAVRQLAAWPRLAQATGFLPALANTWRWLNFGPTVDIGQVILPLLVLGVLASVGVLALLIGQGEKPIRMTRRAAVLLLLWVCLPVALMLALGLYREAYLKFLLTASPAVVLLLAVGVPRPVRDSSRIVAVLASAAFVLTASLVLVPYARALHNYYTEPDYARDDYRAIAAYVEAVGRPGDAVLLNAPGQQEVFGYYYEGALPVHPLPASRPLDPAATEAALKALAPPGGRIFAVLWATDESDPERFIEGWLDTNAYKALDAWYGDVRLAVYAVPERTPEAPDRRLDVRLGSLANDDAITLLGYSQLTGHLATGDIASGDIAPITLFWRAERAPAARYKVFLHALDAGNHIVGQRDAEPGGGARLTILWQPGEVVADNYGLPIHPATPPGAYRVEVGMYDAQTGQRLLTPEGEGQVWLAPLAVERPAVPAPIAALGMQQPAGAGFGELALLGYDAHKLGSDEYAPLRPGDLLHVALYWRADAQPGGDWRVALILVDENGEEQTRIEGEPVLDYPTSRWRAGDVWRGQFSLPIPADASPGDYYLRIQPIAPDGSTPEPFLSEPLAVAR